MRDPAADLWICHLQGRLGAEPQPMGDGYRGTWEEEDSSFLFFSRPEPEVVARTLALRPDLRLVDTYEMSYESWQGQIPAPLRIGRLDIRPPWAPAGPGGGCEPIWLDPGLVFGAGNHPTTRCCLRALEGLFDREVPETALDLGTGTGILALAAARLGCRRVLAMDVNLLAARTALENVRRNRMEDRVLVVRASADHAEAFAGELVVANLHWEAMRRWILSADFPRRRWIVLSGLMRSEARELTDRLAVLPVDIVERWHRDGIWHTFLVRGGGP